MRVLPVGRTTTAMKSLWNEQEAAEFSDSDLNMRVYTSRLLGRESDLVLHGGGNTSVKVSEKNLFDETEEVLYVKGSGWDLKTIEAPGFAPTRLNYLKKLAELETLTDTQMAKELKVSLLDPGAPAPSVEAILHAIIPYKFVDHTHTDAVVALSNTPKGESLLKDLYGERVLILPYIMPGFILAKQVYEATKDIDWEQLDGIMLLHHGLFTFHDEGRVAYEKMIELVDQAEQLLQEMKAPQAIKTATYEATAEDFKTVASLRNKVSKAAGIAMIGQWKIDEHSVGFSQIENVKEIATRGPITPDHTLQTKRIPAIFSGEVEATVNSYVAEYQEYFSQYKKEGLSCLDPAPRSVIWPGKGVVAFGPNKKRAGVVSDIGDHTMKAIQWAEQVSAWEALPKADIFDLEYWELEQAKLKKVSVKPAFEGRIAIVTGAASGIGLACVNTLLAQGACVVGLDINPKVEEQISNASYLGVVCDVTETGAVISALQSGVKFFGGIDIIVSNAGIFPASTKIEELSDEALQKSLDLNFTSHLRLIREALPYLKLGIDPSVVLVASKNVPAPGPGAAAYSTAKAALAQLGRVAALELGESGIRVNMVHPNAVFDTGVWSEEVLEKRAQHYGLSVEEYKRSNVLMTEVTSEDVAQLVASLAGSTFAKTTGAQVPIDGGNDRVI